MPGQCESGYRYHFSVDDVFDALIEVSDRGLALFSHPFFALLQETHERFGTNIDLYLFLSRDGEGGRRHLYEVTAANREHFQRATWLRLGPHALDYATPPHVQTAAEQRRDFEAIYSEIERFAGREKTSRWVRLHYFSETYENAAYLSVRGVDTLLLTDKPAGAYCLPAASREDLLRDGIVRHAELDLRRSHCRLESLAGSDFRESDLSRLLDPILSEAGYLSLFTHEVELRRAEVRRQLFACLRHATGRGMASV